MGKIDNLSRVGRPKLRPQLTQKLDTTKRDEVPIVMRQSLVYQPSLNDFAGADEGRSLCRNIKHGGIPYEAEDEEYRERIYSLTRPQGKRYRTCFVRDV